MLPLQPLGRRDCKIRQACAGKGFGSGPKQTPPSQRAQESQSSLHPETSIEPNSTPKSIPTFAGFSTCSVASFPLVSVRHVAPAALSEHSTIAAPRREANLILKSRPPNQPQLVAPPREEIFFRAVGRVKDARIMRFGVFSLERRFWYPASFALCAKRAIFQFWAF